MYLIGEFDWESNCTTITHAEDMSTSNGWGMRKSSTDDCTIFYTGVDFDGDLENSLINYHSTGDEEYIDNINGPFLSISINHSTSNARIICDKFNRIIAYYTIYNNKFVISTDINMVLKNKHVSLCENSVKEFLYFGYILNNYTPYEGIYTTKSGSIIDLYPNGSDIAYYWNFTPEYTDRRQAGKDVETLYELWQECIKDRLDMIDGDILILLSGGLDSRAILASTLEQVDRSRIQVATFGHPKSDDYKIGKKIAKEFGIKHKYLDLEYPCKHSLKSNVDDTDGMIDAFPRFPINGMNDLLSEYEYVLSGYIGDFITGGYYNPGSYENEYDLVKTYVGKESNREIEGTIHDKLTLKQALDRISYIENPSHQSAFSELFMKEHIDKWSAYTVFRNRHDIKYLSPFVDNRFVEYFHNVSHNQIKNQNHFRKMLFEMYPEMFKIPSTSTHKAPLNASKYRMLINQIPNAFRRRANNLSGKAFGYNPFFNTSTNYLQYNSLYRSDQIFKGLLNSLLQDRVFYSDDLSIDFQIENYEEVSFQPIRRLATIPLWHNNA
ncbi:asparagine synthase-related protein [Natronorubrum sp. A-ect3]|uniref:asparagine synthase-related protein n=1 Tax=Natronorubrum sp. A-ect3 TaxID=3242698 RepID=UPI00359EC316